MVEGTDQLCLLPLVHCSDLSGGSIARCPISLHGFKQRVRSSIVPNLDSAKACGALPLSAI